MKGSEKIYDLLFKLVNAISYKSAYHFDLPWESGFQ